MSFTVGCCGKRRGLLPGGALICPVCDHTPGNGNAPNEAQVRDVHPSVDSITNVILTVGGVTHTIGWIATQEELPGLLEQVAKEMKVIAEDKRKAQQS